MSDRAEERRLMVEQQLRNRDVEDERVLEAMERVPRHLFVPDALRARAYHDAALPIGSDQTISQPYMVARICESLALHGHERVLDVGTGSGYQAAVLAALEGAGYRDRVHVHVGDGTLGLPDHAPFGAIAVAAAAPELQQSLYDQLEPRGRLVVPVGKRQGQQLQLVVRSPEGPAIVRSVSCRFVPLLGEEGFAV